MKHFYLLLILFTSSCFSWALKAQNFEEAHQFHSWFYYIGDHKISDKWGIHPELQYRRTGLGTKPQEFLIRFAVNYHPNDNVMFSAGYVYALQYPYGVFPIDFRFPEHRIYQQAEYNHKIHNIELSHRGRLEQRWIAEITGVPDAGSEGGVRPVREGWPFQNRFRYNLGITIPFQGTSIDNKEYYLFASNEIFFSFGENVSNNQLSQNRAQLGIGYQAGSFGRVEFGYLYQIIKDPDLLQKENNHTLIVAWISRFDFHK
ncbi:MAG: DUF2490 domain-containing protein [Bacteroidota bacterium]|nr:DUF2490 domain-containing protein [Bacteroidota bacterium]